MQCQRCGNPVPPGAQFCNVCGAPAVQPTPSYNQQPMPGPGGSFGYQPTPQPPPQPPPPPKKSKALLIVGLLVGGLLVVALGAGAIGALIYFKGGFGTPTAYDSLPPGDVLVTTDLGTMLNTTVPDALRDVPDARKEFDEGVTQFKDVTGIDPTKLKSISVSISYPSSGSSDPQMAAIVQGDFDLTAIESAIRKSLKSGEDFKTETYESHPILVRTKGRESFAVTLFDKNTAAIGYPSEMVRRVIDARNGKSSSMASNKDFFDAFQSTKPDALVRFAARIPRDMIEREMGSDAKDPKMADLLKTRMVFGSITVKDGYAMVLNGRADNESDARAIKSTLEDLKSMARSAIDREKDAAPFKPILDAVTFTQTGRDVQATASINKSQIDEIQKAIKKSRSAANEASAIGTLRNLASAEATYYSNNSEYGSMSELASENLTYGGLTDGSIRNGYRFTEVYVGSFGFEFKAEPVDADSGERSFNVTDDYTVRYSYGSSAPSGSSGTAVGS